MKRRLFWLFLLTGALLLLMSLMVVGEEQAVTPACEPAGQVVPVTLKPVPPPETEGQVADEAQPLLAADAPKEARPQWAAMPRGLRAYRYTAYYAFHPSDEAG